MVKNLAQKSERPPGHLVFAKPLWASVSSPGNWSKCRCFSYKEAGRISEKINAQRQPGARSTNGGHLLVLLSIPIVCAPTVHKTPSPPLRAAGFKCSWSGPPAFL